MTRPIETTRDKVRHEIYGSRYWLALDGSEAKIVTSMPSLEGAMLTARDYATSCGCPITIFDTCVPDPHVDDMPIVAVVEP